MPKTSVPRSGSLAFIPKKRAKRIYPRVKNWRDSDKLRVSGFAGYKAGMFHALIIDNKKGSPTHGETISVPVTVLDCPSVRGSDVGLNHPPSYPRLRQERLLHRDGSCSSSCFASDQ